MIDDFFEKKGRDPQKLGGAPRIPNNKQYWTDLGKVGKKVMLYFHDDLDGIFSAVAMKMYLLSKDFEIVGYGVVNYQEGWDVVELDTNYINVAVDFAEMTDGIDVYIDHHGEFKDDIDLKGKFAIKTPTFSAYEGIMDQLGLPVDKIVLDVIKMVDAAKYDEYNVAWTDLLIWDFDYFKTHKSPKLMFAGAFNQLLKRGDYRTFVEVVRNATEPSIYQIFHLFKKFYPMNNLDWRFLKDYREYEPTSNEQIIWQLYHLGVLDEEVKDKKGKPKQIFPGFVPDGLDRVNQMTKRTSGTSEHKHLILNQAQFLNEFTEVKSYPITSRSKFAGMSETIIKMDGYVIIGKMAYVPPGTWANAIRARAIIEKDIETGRLVGVKKEDILWVLLQYGDTLQMCSFGNIEEYPTSILPSTEDGDKISDLKVYTRELLEKFVNNYNFRNKYTLSGGHTGIGTISNIGVLKYDYKGNNPFLKKISGRRYLDLMKNHIFRDLTEVSWDISLSWENPFNDSTPEEPVPKNARVMMMNQIRVVDKVSMNIKYPLNYEHKPNLGDLKREASALKAKVEQLDKLRIEQGKNRAMEKHKYYSTRKNNDISFEEWEEQQKEINPS